MKLKHFFVVICLIGAGFTQLLAQSNNRAISSWEEVDHWQIDVFCDGVWTDFIVGEGEVHFVRKYKGGEFIWESSNSKMTAKSTTTDEEFKYIETGKLDWAPMGPGEIVTMRFNFQLKGNMGTHYTGFLFVYVYVDETGVHVDLVPKNVTCH